MKATPWRMPEPEPEPEPGPEPEPEPDPYARWSLSDRLQMLAFEAELAQLPRGLIAALWEAIDRVGEGTPRSVTGGACLLKWLGT